MPPPADGLLEREIELEDGTSLFVAEDPTAADEQTGATCWDAGLVLAHYLIKAHATGALDLAQQRVIELGAGTGVVGLTAAALGAQQVVLTDRPRLLPHLQRNIQRNQLQARTQAVALEWGEPLPGSLQPPFQLVLCGDIVYTPASVGPLLATLQALTGPGSLVLLSCEFREGAGLEQLMQQLAEHGLQEQLVPYTDLHEDFCSPDILLWRIRPVTPASKAAGGEEALSERRTHAGGL